MKGIVADVSRKKAVLISENGEFVTVRNNNYSVGQQVSYQIPAYTRFASAAACAAVLVAVGFGGVKAYFTPTSYIDIDINPSMRLEINALDRVIEIKPLNTDAVALIEKSERFSHGIGSCITEIIDASEKCGYINESDKDVNIAVISKRKKVLDRAKKCREDIVSHSDIHISLETDTNEHLDKAKKLDISVGKLKAIEEYSAAKGGSVEENTNLLKGKSNADILNLVNVPTDSTSITAEPSEFLTDGTAVEKAAGTDKSSRNSKTAATQKPVPGGEETAGAAPVNTPKPITKTVEPEKNYNSVKTQPSVQEDKPAETKKPEKTSEPEKTQAPAPAVSDKPINNKPAQKTTPKPAENKDKQLWEKQRRDESYEKNRQDNFRERNDRQDNRQNYGDKGSYGRNGKK